MCGDGVCACRGGVGEGGTMRAKGSEAKGAEKEIMWD